MHGGSPGTWETRRPPHENRHGESRTKKLQAPRHASEARGIEAPMHVAVPEGEQGKASRGKGSRESEHRVVPRKPANRQPREPAEGRRCQVTTITGEKDEPDTEPGNRLNATL